MSFDLLLTLPNHQHSLTINTRSISPNSIWSMEFHLVILSSHSKFPPENQNKSPVLYILPSPNRILQKEIAVALGKFTLPASVSKCIPWSSKITQPPERRGWKKFKRMDIEEEWWELEADFSVLCWELLLEIQLVVPQCLMTYLNSYQQLFVTHFDML